ncbi:hypothetical protein [Paenibacillus amylolyticus]|uniref:hypothetical protein n=1 Tax=Paenibacillus amylolyticus TaxID=1451 RepID=UPI0033973454
MASFVLLLKDYEDEEKVIYHFGPNEQIMGKIELNKKNETIQEVTHVVNANNESKFYFDRAAQRLAMCLNRENGQFPNQQHLNRKNNATSIGYPTFEGFFDLSIYV